MKAVKNITVILAIISSLLQGATPTISDALRDTQTPKELNKKQDKPLVKIKGAKPIYRPKLQDDKKFKKVFVKSFNIKGNIHIKSEKLQKLINSYKNKKLSFNDMQTVASIITSVYRKDGYIVARAYIPVQDMNDGVLQIVIIEGVYGEFKLINNSQVKTSLIQSILDNSKKAGVINNNSLERGLLILNELPDVVVSNAGITSGKNIGTSDFLITVENSKAYDGYVLVNNYGGRYTGEEQLIAGLNLYSPFKIGDKLSLTGIVSNGVDLKNGSISYGFPIYTNGLRAEIGYSNTSYSLAKEFKNLNATGSSKSYHVKLTYPLVKKRAEQLDMFVKLEENVLSDEIGSTNFKSDKNLYAYRLGLDYAKKDLTWFNLNQQLKVSMVLTHGKLEFKDASQRALDKAGVNTDGSFSKMKFSLDYNIELNKHITLENSFKYQHALGGKNLDGSEDFSIGGVYGVKLYPSGELSAENGYLLKLEAKYKLQNINTLSHKVGLFYETGKAYMQNPTATFKSKTLQDIGIGYYMNYKTYFLNTHIALKMDNVNISSEPDKSYKFLLMLGRSF